MQKIIKLFFFLFLPSTGLASFIIDNNTKEYVTFYVTSTALCPAKENNYVPPQTPNFELTQTQMLHYCHLNNPCYIYLYATNTIDNAKICNGEFVGILQWDLKKEIIQDLYTANSKYSITGENTNKLTWNLY